MKYITQIKKQRGFVIAEFDDGPSLRVPTSLFKERPLIVGAVYDEKTYIAWLDEREYPHALDRAVTFLSTRARTEQELETKLKQCGYTPRAIARVIARLAQDGYVNDAQFADEWSLARSSRALGKHRIAQELNRKGVSREIVENALSSLDEVEMLQTATAHAEKLIKRIKGKDQWDTRRKILAALARRGYDYSLSKEALARAMGGESEEAFDSNDEFYDE